MVPVLGYSIRRAKYNNGGFFGHSKITQADSEKIQAIFPKKPQANWLKTQ